MPLFKTKTEKKKNEAILDEYLDSGHCPIKQKARVFLEKSLVVDAFLIERKEKKEDERLRAFTDTFNERAPSPTARRRSSTRQRASAFSRKAWSRTKEKAGAFKFYMMTGSRPAFWSSDTCMFIGILFQGKSNVE